MCQPTTLLIAVVLLVGTAAQAQPSPTRERRERTVTLTGNPSDPPLEIRAAQGIATVLLFKSRIIRDAVEVDRTRVRILDAGDWSIIFEPVSELGRDERLVLTVQFADEQRAPFVLVSHVSEVDTRIEVVRRKQPIEACQAEVIELKARCRAQGPLEFARAGYLTNSGIKTTGLQPYRDEAGAFEVLEGISHLGATWVLVAVTIRNLSGQPWVPQEATFTNKAGTPVAVRAMAAEPRELSLGQEAWILVETEVPPKSAGRQFVLRMRGMDERIFTMPTVNLPPVEEDKR